MERTLKIIIPYLFLKENDIMAEVTYESLLELYNSYLDDYKIRYARTNIVYAAGEGSVQGIPTETSEPSLPPAQQRPPTNPSQQQGSSRVPRNNSGY